MKFLPDIPPARKAIGIALVAVVAVVVVEGLGLTAPPKAFIAGIASQVKGFFTGLFNKKPSGI
jgi:hypothetical protein